MKNDNIALIVPVVQTKMAHELFESVKENVYRPQQIIVIDNSVSGFVSPLRGTQVIRHGRAPLEVNPSWTFASSFLQTDIDIVVIVNDDVLLNPLFFDKVADTFNKYPKAGYVVPATVNNKNAFNEISPTLDNSIRHVRIKSGWCFALNRILLSLIPPIPDELETFFGDTWYYMFAIRAGLQRLQMRNNVIYHYGGATLKSKSVISYRRKRAKEKTIYNQLIEGALNSWRTPALI